MAKYQLGEIQPNPFRHIDRYPIDPRKVESLRKSIQTTSFWDNIVARERNGKAEIAYGHHRWVALKEEYPPDHEVELIIRDLGDEQMLKIMANENMSEWGSSVQVEHETVRAVVEAYAKGQIHLDRPLLYSYTWRCAPSFAERNPGTSGADDPHPYTANGVAAFLGWTKESGEATVRVTDALAALEFIESGILTEADFSGLGTAQAHVVIQQARRAKREREVQAKLAEQAAERQRKAAEEAQRRKVQAEEERRKREEQAARAREETERQRRLAQAEEARQAAAIADQQRILAEQRQRVATQRAEQERQEGRQEAQKVARHVGGQIKSGKIGVHGARDAANEVRQKKDMPPPMIDEFARRIAVQLHKILHEQDGTAKNLEELIRFQSYMNDHSIGQLIAELDSLIGRAESLRDSLRNGHNNATNGNGTGMIVTEVLQLSA
jgi:ParB-like nuclease domain